MRMAPAQVVKKILLVLAGVAMAASISPVLAQFHRPPNADADQGGGSTWTVVCSYDGAERLTGKTCTSGGSTSCNCP